MAKTSLQLKYKPSSWPVVEQWADENQYTLETSGENSRIYLRGGPEANATIRVAITQLGEAVQIEAWYSDFIRKELAIDSNSLYAALPRNKAVAEVKKLLVAFGAISPDKEEDAKKRNAAFNLGRSIRKLSGKK